MAATTGDRTTPSVQDTTQNLIMKLSPELRNQVYGYLFEHDERRLRTRPLRQGEHNIPTGAKALTQVCHDIRQETLPLYYSKRVYRIDMAVRTRGSQALLPDWLNSLDSLAVASLRRLDFETILGCWLVFDTDLGREDGQWTRYVRTNRDCVCWDKYHRQAPEKKKVDELVERYLFDQGRVCLTVAKIAAFVGALSGLYDHPDSFKGIVYQEASDSD